MTPSSGPGEGREALADQLEALREQGIPCPFCGQSVAWELSKKGKNDILDSVSQEGGVHEKLIECDKEDCPSTEMNIPFLRRIFRNAAGELVMEFPDPAEMPKALLAEVQSLRLGQTILTEQLRANADAVQAQEERNAAELGRLRASLMEQTAEVLRLQAELRTAENGHPKDVVSTAERRELEARGALQQVCKNTGGAIEWPPRDGEITPEFTRALGQFIKAVREDADLLRTFVHTLKIRQADLPDLAKKMMDLQSDADFLADVLGKLGWSQEQLLAAANQQGAARAAQHSRVQSRARMGASARQVVRSFVGGIGLGRFLKPEGDKKTDSSEGQS